MAQGQSDRSSRRPSRPPRKGAYIPPVARDAHEQLYITYPPPGQDNTFLRQAKMVNSMRARSGASRGVNAADVSMNNPRMWKDEAGHLWNPKTGKQLPHPTSHSHDVSVSNPPDWS